MTRQQPWVVPLSLSARLLATQLASETLSPRILLPPHLLKSYRNNESIMSYVNKISISNPFQRKHKLQASSVKLLERLQEPLTLVIPASQLTPILDPSPMDARETIVPPPGSDILIVDPYFGQVEAYANRIRPYYYNEDATVETAEPPRIWSVISTHLLTNTSGWTVEHASMGELKISHVPFQFKYNHKTIETLVKESPIIQQLLTTPLLLPQLQSQEQTSTFLAEQMIMESAMSLMTHPEYTPLYKELKYHATSSHMDTHIDMEADFAGDRVILLKKTLLRIVEESIKVIRGTSLAKEMLASSPVLNAVLSRERMFNKVLNIIYSDDAVSHLMATVDPHKEITKRKKILERITSRETRFTRNGSNEDDNEIPGNSRKADRENDKGNIPMRSIHLRNPAKANRFICKEGQKLGIRTTMNQMVCSKFSVKELRDESELLSASASK